MMARNKKKSIDNGQAPLGGIGINTARVEGVEKRKKPNKHYAFVINIAWTDGTVNIIYRRYSDFYDLQCLLLKQFKKEAGTKKPTDRILPFLPGRALFGRKEKVAMGRIQSLDEYCKVLVALPSYISNSQGVMHFFHPTEEDIEFSRKGTIRKDSSGAEEISGPITLEMYVAIADYKRDNNDQIDLKEGMEVEVIEKHVTGWWMVTAEDNQGWVPSTYLEKANKGPDDEPEAVVRCAPGSEERYIVTAIHHPDLSDELELKPGAVVDVIEKTLDGWWLVRSGDRTGRAPGTKMSRADTCKARAAINHGAYARKTSSGDVADDKSAQVDDEPFTPVSHPPPRRETLTVKPRHLRKTRKTVRGQKYQVTEHFRPSGQGMAVTRGQVLVLMEKSPGWWLMRHGEDQGWVPSDVLRKEGAHLSAIPAGSSTEEDPGASNVNDENAKHSLLRKASSSDKSPAEDVEDIEPKMNEEIPIYANIKNQSGVFDNNDVCTSIPSDDNLDFPVPVDTSSEMPQTESVSCGTKVEEPEELPPSTTSVSVSTTRPSLSKLSMTSRSTSIDHDMVASPTKPVVAAKPSLAVMTSRSTSYDQDIAEEEDEPEPVLPKIKDKEVFGTVTVRRGLVAQRSQSFNKGSSGKERKNSAEMCFVNSGSLERQSSNEAPTYENVKLNNETPEPASPEKAKPKSPVSVKPKPRLFRRKDEDTVQLETSQGEQQQQSQKHSTATSTSAVEAENKLASHRGAVSLDVTIGENPSPQQGATYNLNSNIAFLPLEELEGKPVYMARTNFTGGEDNEVDLEFGELVVVLEKAGRGWWKVQSKSGVGWVPSHFLRNTAEVFSSNKETQEEEPANTALTEKQKLQRVPRELPDYSTAKPKPRERVKPAPVARKVNQQLSKGKENKQNVMSVRIVEDNHKPVDEILKMFHENGS